MSQTVRNEQSERTKRTVRTLCHYTYVTVPSASVEVKRRILSPDGTYKPNALKALILGRNLISQS